MRDYLFLIFVFSPLFLLLFTCNPRPTFAPANFDRIYPIKDQGRWGFINGRGEQSIVTEYLDANLSFQGRASIKTESGWGFISSDGIILIKPQYALVSHFSEDKAAFMKDNKWGYLDSRGNVIINAIFDYAWPFFVDRAAVLIGDRIGYIDPQGNFRIKPDLDYAYSFSGGLLPFRSQNGLMGFLDRDGNIAISAIFDQTSNFSDEKALVVINGSYSFINKKGRSVISDSFHYAASFSDTLAAISDSSGKIGFINAQGNMQIKPSYQWHRHLGFVNGLSAVTDGNLWGYINQKNELIIKYQFKQAWPFLGDLAPVQFISGSWGYIDQTGKTMWQSK